MQQQIKTQTKSLVSVFGWVGIDGHAVWTVIIDRSTPHGGCPMPEGQGRDRSGKYQTVRV